MQYQKSFAPYFGAKHTKLIITKNYVIVYTNLRKNWQIMHKKTIFQELFLEDLIICDI